MSESLNLSEICVKRCNGLCCRPWWGIIAYSAGRDGAVNAAGLRPELLKGLRLRCARIMDAYVTNEKPLRPLFKPPDRYNLLVKDARPNGKGLTLDLIAMFAFQCLYLSEDNTCSIHPSLSGGRDIRPPHCAALGSPDAIEGGKGYCRIIHAATSTDVSMREAAIERAIELEKTTSARHYEEGFATAEEAVDAVMGRIAEYLPKQATTASDGKQAGRNDPCPCGSGQKFKKCHGR